MMSILSMILADQMGWEVPGFGLRSRCQLAFFISKYKQMVSISCGRVLSLIPLQLVPCLSLA
jgi:hypothetical protein